MQVLRASSHLALDKKQVVARVDTGKVVRDRGLRSSRESQVLVLAQRLAKAVRRGRGWKKLPNPCVLIVSIVIKFWPMKGVKGRCGFPRHCAGKAERTLLAD